jgi:hypothetical protein
VGRYSWEERIARLRKAAEAWAEQFDRKDDDAITWMRTAYPVERELRAAVKELQSSGD